MRKKSTSKATSKSTNGKKGVSLIETSDQIKRLNKIAGQINGVKRMIEENRTCSEIMMQTSAVCSAVRSLEAAILEANLHGFVKEALVNKNEKDAVKKIEEIAQVFKKHL